MNPLDSPRMLEVCPSPSRARRKPPRAAAVQAASCEDLSATTSQRTFMRPNTPMGRVDIAPSKGPPSNPYAILSPGTRGCPLTPADRYDVLPSSEDPYGRRYTRNPHPSRGRLAGEEGPAPSLARQLQNRVSRKYCSKWHSGFGAMLTLTLTPPLTFPRLLGSGPKLSFPIDWTFPGFSRVSTSWSTGEYPRRAHAAQPSWFSHPYFMFTVLCTPLPSYACLAQPRRVNDPKH